MKILVVDDMTSMRHVMLHMLKDIGHEQVDEAVNGLQALDKLRAQKYDLLITDYHMPKLDGVQLLKRLRLDKALINLPVIMVTCEDQRNEVKSIIKAKVNGFIVKPFTTNTLIKQLALIQQPNSQTKTKELQVANN